MPPPLALPLVAMRGGQWLVAEELRAHLAAAARLENVGVLLGAGASMGPLGGKAMAALWSDFTTASPSSLGWLVSNGFVAPGTVNAEHLTDALDIAVREWTRAGDHRLTDARAVRSDLARATLRASLLQPTWWTTPDAVDLSTPQLASHRALLKKLVAARQPGQAAPWLFTTNYDLAIEWAAESIGLRVINGFDGLHRRTFAPHNFDLGLRNVLARGEARFGTYNIYLAKMHGSLSWTDEGPDVREHAAHARWPALEAFLRGAVQDLPALLVQPSAAKYVQTVGFVMGELIRRFVEFLSRPQTVLITSGFSFADDHLNRLLISALQNPTLQLIIYLPEFVRTVNDEPDASKCQRWAQKLLALATPQVTFVGGGPRAFFSEVAKDLPDPALYDDAAFAMRDRLRKLAGQP